MPGQLTNFEKVVEEKNADVYLGTKDLTKPLKKWTRRVLSMVHMRRSILRRLMLLA